MKTLIIFYSFTRNNEILANNLKGRLSCDMMKIEEVKKRTALTIILDIIFKRGTKLKPHKQLLSDYDNFIFMAPIWVGRLATPLKSFLKKNSKEISRYSFITVCGGVDGQKEKITRQLTKLLDIRPEQVTELWVTDLLTGSGKNNKTTSTGYQIEEKDLIVFEDKIQDFLKVNMVESHSVK